MHKFNVRCLYLWSIKPKKQHQQKKQVATVARNQKYTTKIQKWRKPWKRPDSTCRCSSSTNSTSKLGILNQIVPLSVLQIIYEVELKKACFVIRLVPILHSFGHKFVQFGYASKKHTQSCGF